MRRLIIGALVAIAAVACTACIPEYTGNPSGPKLAIIGDSITYDTADEFHDVFDPSYHVAVDGRPGHTVGDMQGVADEFAATSPDIIVINLGQNDAIQGHDPNATALGLLYMTTKFPNSCVILTTLNEHTGVPAWDAFAAQLNGGIRLGRHIDWSQGVVWFEWQGWTLFGPNDRVHPNGTGQDVLAFLTAQEVGAC